MPGSQFLRAVDTASFGARAIALAIACYGADRVVLGTDCPIFGVGQMLDALEHAHISSEARHGVLTANARILFGAEL